MAALAPLALRRSLPVAGIALIAAGLALLGWLGWRSLHPPPAPYTYRLVAEGQADKFPDLGLHSGDGFTVRKFELRVGTAEEPAALLHVANRVGAAPVLLDWLNRSVEPTLAFNTRSADVVALSEAFAKHAPPGARVLAWWDTSRQLKLLAGAAVLYDANFSKPLILPSAWRGAREAIEAVEQEFWQATPDREALQRFDRYVDALVSETPDALATLRELAGTREAFVIVRLADAYRVGLLRPERFGVGYRDFPMSVRLHGAISSVKAWLKEQGYDSYAVEARDEGTLRVYFLTNAASQNALIAKLLPFSTSNPFALEALQIVHQQGPYWVYKLPQVG